MRFKLIVTFVTWPDLEIGFETLDAAKAEGERRIKADMTTHREIESVSIDDPVRGVTWNAALDGEDEIIWE